MYHCQFCSEGWCFFPMIFFVALIIFWIIILRRRGYICDWRGFRSKWMQEFVSDPNKIKSPIEILQSRYAKGDISKEEFEQMKKDILDEK